MSQPPQRDAAGLPSGDGELVADGLAGQAQTAAADPRFTIPPGDLDSRASGSEVGRTLLSYASSWFTYHAGQRLQSFNFFIALQTALLAVVVLQYGTTGKGTLLAFGAVGILGTLLFAALEIRNTELVLAAGATLAALETALQDGTGGEAAAIPLPQTSDNARRYLRSALIGFLAPVPIEPIGCRPEHSRRYTVLGYVIRNSFVLRLIFLLTLAGWLVFVSLILASYQPSRPSCSLTVRGGTVARVVCADTSRG